MLLLAGLLFVPAGRLDWPAGWALVGLTTLWVGGTALVLIVLHPGLIAERLGPRPGTKTWDIAIMGVVGALTVVRCVVAGLDARFGWTAALPLPLHLGALAVATTGYGLVVWATAANAFFSQTARIQVERGHTVATAGPYRLVRHPGYVGTILAELAIPVMLGSWWALAPGGAIAALFVARTGLEDQMLLAELDGYRAYAERVRWRLLPGIW